MNICFKEISLEHIKPYYVGFATKISIQHVGSATVTVYCSNDGENYTTRVTIYGNGIVEILPYKYILLNIPGGEPCKAILMFNRPRVNL